MPANDTNTPKLFYIQSNLGNSDWVLALDGAGKVRLAHKSGALGQLWSREDDPRGGFFLIHADTGRCLDWTGGRGAEVTLQPKTLGNPHLLWVQVDTGNWSFLYAANWNQALNVFGSGGYGENSGVGLWEGSGGQANELWKIVPETGEVKVESIKYEMGAAKVNLNLPPAMGVVTSVDNRGGSTPLNTNVELQRVVVTSRQFTYSSSSSQALKVATTYGAKLGIDKVVEFSGQTAVENTATQSTSLTEQSVQTNTQSDKLTVSAQVPPRGRYEYAVRVYYGSVNVPYTATISRMLPTGAKELSEISGTYTNVSMVNHDIVGNDVSDGTAKPLQAITAREGALA